MSITIAERSPYPMTTGQAIDLNSPEVDIVRRMKLEEAIRSMHTTEFGTTFLYSSRKPVTQFIKGDIFTCNYKILRGDLFSNRREEELIQSECIVCLATYV